MSIDHYELPDGTVTTDVDEYLCAWQSLEVEAMCRLFGWKVYGFDPGYTFQDCRNNLLSLGYKQVLDIISALKKFGIILESK